MWLLGPKASFLTRILQVFPALEEEVRKEIVLESMLSLVIHVSLSTSTQPGILELLLDNCLLSCCHEQ